MNYLNRLCRLGAVIGMLMLSGRVAGAVESAEVVATRQTLTKFLKLNNAGKLNTKPAKELLEGEALQFVTSPTLGPLSPADKVMLIDASHTTARAPQPDGQGGVVDVYFYFHKSKTWKLSALRTFAMTNIVQMAIDEMEQRKTLTADEKAKLANMKLTLASDGELKKHFFKHQAAFRELASLTVAPRKNKARSAALERTVALDAVSGDVGGEVQFIIGGMVDNTVGYLYSPSNKPPRISPQEYIWVEKLADKWYLFRTT